MMRIVNKTGNASKAINRTTTLCYRSAFASKFGLFGVTDIDQTYFYETRILQLSKQYK